MPIIQDDSDSDDSSSDDDGDDVDEDDMGDGNGQVNVDALEVTRELINQRFHV